MSRLTEASRWALWFAPMAASLFAARGLLHYFQLGSYQFAAYLGTLKRQRRRAWLSGGVLGLVSLAAAYGAGRFSSGPAAGFVLAAVVLAFGWLAGRRSGKRRGEIRPFQRTWRVRRLYASLALCGLGAGLLLHRLLPVMWASALWPLLLPLWVALAALLVWPLEKAVAAFYQRDARRILRAQTGLVTVGITGSFGKTTVKAILTEMLLQRTAVLATPRSFNTPMGLTRCIRESLRPEHRVFIAEMGARHPWDIQVLCRLARPQIGILTGIGSQHSATLGGPEGVLRTKFDLIRSLPQDGFAVFYNDAEGVGAQLCSQTRCPAVLVGREGDACWAEDIKTGLGGGAFTLCTDDGLRLPCETSLPGEHNVRNILMAAAVARHLGLSPRQLVRGIEAVRVVQARMEPVPKASGALMINNGFNSSPETSRQSLALLAEQSGRKAVVTPGFIELGRLEEEENRDFGRRIAACADVALLIGPRHTRPIAEGLKEAGFDPGNIHVFRTLGEANAWLEGWEQPGDAVLYENDLPDHYSEA